MSYQVKCIRTWVPGSFPREFLQPGTYKWWADEDTCTVILGEYFKEIWPMMTRGEGDCKGMRLVYVGITTKMSLWQRVCKWHIQERHTHSKVVHKTLSTLRQSLASLLGDDWMDERGVHKLQDSMRVEVRPSQYPIRDPRLLVEAEAIENEMMQTHVLPLNIQTNHNPAVQEYKTYLRERRRTSRLATLQRIGN